MKKLLLFAFALLCVTNLFAQAPQKISYQAVIRNASNTLVSNTVVGMRISILQGSATGTVVYKERQTPTTNANGLASIQIGGGNVLSGVFANINWASGTYFIKTETDPLGGTAYSITGTTQMLSVPYALYATKSGNGFNHYIGELYGGGIVYYVYKDTLGVEHGLIASLTDLNNASNNNQSWSNVTVAVGLGAQSIYDGFSNSNAIINQPGHINSWAQICRNYNAGGFTDWYLPSYFELSKLFDQIFLIAKNKASANINYGYYWISTEVPGSAGVYAYTLGIPYFGAVTSLVQQDKTFYGYNVRAIRAF